jgi:hypothetical protein
MSTYTTANPQPVDPVEQLIDQYDELDVDFCDPWGDDGKEDTHICNCGIVWVGDELCQRCYKADLDDVERGE